MAHAYERTLGRPATAGETARALKFVQSLREEWKTRGATPHGEQVLKSWCAGLVQGAAVGKRVRVFWNEVLP